jgi:hypothetical protein
MKYPFIQKVIENLDAFEANKKWDEDFWRIRENENLPKTDGIL